jgi:TPR repeat protein
MLFNDVSFSNPVILSDKATSYKYYLKAVEKGHDDVITEPQDQFQFGLMHYSREKHKDALPWFHKVAEGQHANAKLRVQAQYYLAVIYLRKDPKQARVYFEKVAASNDTDREITELVHLSQAKLREKF